MDTTRVEKILDALEGLYPEAKAELHFSNPFETLIATILSAQCTDKRVNQVTEKLFPLYPDAKAMARLTPEELEPMIRECGLYHSKAKNIVAACRALVEQYDGQVPADRKKLWLCRSGTENRRGGADGGLWRRPDPRGYPRFPGDPAHRPGGRGYPRESRNAIAAGTAPGKVVPRPSSADLAWPPHLSCPGAGMRPVSLERALV